MKNARGIATLKQSARILAALLLFTLFAPPVAVRSMKTPAAPQTATGTGEARMRVAMIVRMAVNPLSRHPLDRRLEARSAPLSSALPPASRPLPEAQARRVASVKIPASGGHASAAMVHARASLELLKNMPSPASPKVSAAPARSILALGDSLSIGLADALEKRFAKKTGLRFAKFGKVSSGLARPDFFDWEKRAKELAAEHQPDVAVIMIAANDNKTMTAPSGARYAFGRPGWNEEYARRVQNIIDIIRNHNPDAKIFWAGAPAMADPNLDRDVKAIHGVIKAQLAKNPQAWFVETRKALADADGHFAQYLSAHGKRLKIRAGDGVHLTPAGAGLLAETCLAAMSQRIVLADGESPRPLLLSENAAP